MKVCYEAFILTSLIFYSILSIALLGPWMYRKARSLLAAGRSSSDRVGKTGRSPLDLSPNSNEGEDARGERLCEASSLSSLP